MAQSGKGKLNFRCPSCFMRDLDIDMFYDNNRYIGIRITHFQNISLYLNI